jgi:hypothetical protein
MKGDFSNWGITATDNFSGVLHQQGRVLLDQDWNASEQIARHWREMAGQDVMGAGVAAVPIATPDSLKVTQATATAAAVTVTLQPGRLWADGIPVYYTGAAPLTATYLAPPLQTPQAAIATIGAGVRDAVILEVWDDAFSAFQDPLHLLEPALGGPDTTERLQTSMALKLMRMAPGDDCANLALTDVFSAKGRLTVSPSPTVVIAGPCPVPDSGGYSGFEHYLYRIEIAAPDAAGKARFKWSQYNGGLVGRGAFSATGAATGTVAISANNQMINQCALDTFYLEALTFDTALGHWRVVLSANATLASADSLSLTAIEGSWPAGATGFFRLWNKIDLVSNFPTGLAPANELKDGIRVAFDAALAGNGNYTPGDFWTFPARAAGVAFDPTVWPSNAPPHGVHYHRAPLAVLNWTGVSTVTVKAADGEIHDCRLPFLPLTKIRTCCTYTVGDGIHSFGQFGTIQAAVNALPPQGGTVCVLAGIYDESVRIDKRAAIRIHGCGPATRIQAGNINGIPLPAFMISNSSAIALEDMAIEAGPRSAVQIDNARHVTLAHCLIQMRDLPTLWQAVYSRGDDILIDSNIVEVLPREGGAPAPTVPPALGSFGAPAGVNTAPAPIVLGFATRGGIQLAGGSDRVRVLRNVIRGGIWNGITLGSLVPVGSQGEDDTPDLPTSEDPCDPCRPVDLTGEDPAGGEVRFESAGDLYDIEIAGNRISDMGINGIGVVRFFNLANGGGLIGVHGLHIMDNFIARCMRRSLAPLTPAMQALVGYGGIALAKVSDLRILRNQILSNGSSSLDPICGVFAIFAQGLQLDDNRILDNGPKGKAPAADVHIGVRGGVHVWIVLPIVEQAAGATLASSYVSPRPAHNGIPSCSVRDNIVVAPLGRALTFFALGSVVVARNRLVTQGSTGRGLDLLCATVLIGNFGVSNEWTLGLLVAWILRLSGKAREGEQLCRFAKLYGLVNPSRPPKLWPPLVRQWASGKTLFTENQVTLDLMDQPPGFGVSSVLVLTFDDLGMTDNQCEITSTNVFYYFDAILLGGSVRVADNRFAETWMHTGFSALSVGGMNTTTDNQSTHCLVALALLPGMRMFKHNLSLVRAFCPGECGDIGYGETN